MGQIGIEQVFSILNLVVLPFWGLAILAPGWRWTRRVLESPWIAVPPALIYAALLLPRLPEALRLLANPDLGPIAAGLGTPEGATVAWAHLVTFDLFVGRWIYLESRDRGVPWWLSSPILLAVLFFGPLGLLAYLAGVRRRGGDR